MKKESIMGILVNVAAEIVGIALIYIVIARLKSRIITETQAIPWIISAVVVMVLGFWPNVIKLLPVGLGLVCSDNSYRDDNSFDNVYYFQSYIRYIKNLRVRCRNYLCR
jgi:hypothetical protein